MDVKYKYFSWEKKISYPICTRQKCLILFTAIMWSCVYVCVYIYTYISLQPSTNLVHSFIIKICYMSFGHSQIFWIWFRIYIFTLNQIVNFFFFFLICNILYFHTILKLSFMKYLFFQFCICPKINKKCNVISILKAPFLFSFK